jgi:hypothetical protein
MSRDRAYEAIAANDVVAQPEPVDDPTGEPVAAGENGRGVGTVLDAGSANRAAEPYLSYRDVRDLEAGRGADEGSRTRAARGELPLDAEVEQGLRSCSAR